MRGLINICRMSEEGECLADDSSAKNKPGGRPWRCRAASSRVSTGFARYSGVQARSPGPSRGILAGSWFEPTLGRARERTTDVHTVLSPRGLHQRVTKHRHTRSPPRASVRPPIARAYVRSHADAAYVSAHRVQILRYS